MKKLFMLTIMISLFALAALPALAQTNSAANPPSRDAIKQQRAEKREAKWQARSKKQFDEYNERWEKHKAKKKTIDKADEKELQEWKDKRDKLEQVFYKRYMADRRHRRKARAKKHASHKVGYFYKDTHSGDVNFKLVKDFSD
jgi:hypothetical protein